MKPAVWIWTAVIVAAGCTAVYGWRAFSSPSVDDQLYTYGIARGRADEAAGLHKPEDVDDLQLALQYLDEPNLENGKRSPLTPGLVKAVLDAPEDVQKRYLHTFARGYQKGYAEASLGSK